MTIQNNLSAVSAMNKLMINANQTRNNMQQLASGSRINRAGNDPAGLAVAMKMQTQIGGTDMAVRNANDGIGLIQTAEGALSETHTMLSRLKMLSVQSSSGLLSSDQRSFIQMEADQIMSEINRISQATDFNGIRPLNGSLAGDGGMVLQIGDRNGEPQQATVNINNMSSAAIGLAGFNISTQNGALNALGLTDNAVNTVSEQRASLGAMQNRLEHTVNSLINTSENLTAAKSRIADADMASSVIENTKNNILRQASLAMLAHAVEQPKGLSTLWDSAAPPRSFRV